MMTLIIWDIRWNLSLIHICAGYIGSHTVVELQNAGYDVVVLNNLRNASEKALDRASKITGKPVKFYKTDILWQQSMFCKL